MPELTVLTLGGVEGGGGGVSWVLRFRAAGQDAIIGCNLHTRAAWSDGCELASCGTRSHALTRNIIIRSSRH